LGELTKQQTWVIDNITQNNKTILDMSEDIRSRVKVIVTSSAALSGLLLSNKIFFNVDNTLLYDSILSCILLCSIAVYWMAAQIWTRRLTYVAGTNNIDKLYDSYINKDLDDCYYGFLVDLCDTYESNKGENNTQSNRLSIATTLFTAQVALVVIYLLVSVCIGLNT